MMKKQISIFVLMLASLGILGAAPAWAEPPVAAEKRPVLSEHQKKPEIKKQKNSQAKKQKKAKKIKAVISKDDRKIIGTYLNINFRPNCPPGLAKKHNGCLPPGIARKYTVGQKLPDGVWESLPGELLKKLHPPAGFHYAQVDRDVVLVSEATKKVVDAVTLLSAMQ